MKSRLFAYPLLSLLAFHASAQKLAMTSVASALLH
jgi:hypothetical protein